MCIFFKKSNAKSSSYFVGVQQKEREETEDEVNKAILPTVRTILYRIFGTAVGAVNLLCLKSYLVSILGLPEQEETLLEKDYLSTVP